MGADDEPTVRREVSPRSDEPVTGTRAGLPADVARKKLPPFDRRLDVTAAESRSLLVGEAATIAGVRSTCGEVTRIDEEGFWIDSADRGTTTSRASRSLMVESRLTTRDRSIRSEPVRPSKTRASSDAGVTRRGDAVIRGLDVTAAIVLRSATVRRGCPP